MKISFSQIVAEHINKSQESHPGSIGMRVSIGLSGCSGYAYKIDYANSINADDEVFEQYGAKVIVDSKSLKLIDGTEIDYISKGLNKELVFKNPLAAAHCGCGESFTLIDDSQAD